MPMSLDLKLTVLGITALLVSAAASAELYQWKDAKGKIIYSDRPPVESQKALTVDEVENGKKPEPPSELAREEARQKKAKESNKRLVKWRCAELEKQHASLLKEYQSAQTSSANKAAALKIDIENHQDSIDRMCK